MSILKVFLRTLATIALFIAQVILSPPANAAPGDLDPSFGTGGEVITSFAEDAAAQAVAVQSDGKLVVAGWTRIGGTPTFALARYNVDGSLDSSFGTGGRLLTDFGTGSVANAVAIQPDGKIVAAGLVFGIVEDFALARYNPDGSLDPTFGTGGKLTTDFGSNDRAGSVLIQPDGKIVAAGGAEEGGILARSFSVARYSPDGSLDPTFGTGGNVSTNFGDSFGELGRAAVLQPDGKIVEVGFTLDGCCSQQDFALVRFNSDGTLDGTFGSGGKVTTDFDGQFDDAWAVAVQADGKLVAAGGAALPTGKGGFGLARYNANGSLDSTFGTAGRVIADFGPNSGQARSIELGPNGKIIAAGFAVPLSFAGDFALARFNPDGSLDPSFGTGGEVTTDFSGGSEVANGMALQADGKVVAVGVTVPSTGVAAFALARYLGEPTVTEVTIDIKPGNMVNLINLSSNGLIPVAILTTDSFGATTVDPSSVCLGDDDNPSQRDCTEAHGKGHIEDVNGDGRPDLLLHYEVSQTGIDPGDTTVCLTGKTFAGVSIEGCDSIRTR